MIEYHSLRGEVKNMMRRLDRNNLKQLKEDIKINVVNK